MPTLLMEVREVVKRLEKLQKEVGTEADADAEEASDGRLVSRDEFLTLKSRLLAELRDLKENVNERDEMERANADPREVIQVNLEISKKMKEVQQMVDSFKEMLKKEAGRRRSKLSEEDMQLRREIIDDIIGQYREVSEMAQRRAGRKKGEPSPADIDLDELEDTTFAISLDTFTSGGGADASAASAAGGAGAGGGADYVEESLSPEHKQVLQQLQEGQKAQDHLLDEISSAVQVLREMAVNIGEKVAAQGAVIDAATEKVEKVNEKIKRVNKKLDEQLREARGADKICMDIICCVLILGVGMVVYNLIKDRV